MDDTLRQPRKRRVPILLASGVFVCLVLAFLVHVRKDMSDFGVCVQAGRRILDGETLYRVSDEHRQFKYAPVSAFVFVPFALLPWEAAQAVWFAGQVILLSAGGWLATRLISRPGKSPWLIAGLGALAGLKFLGREIELGQVNALILFLLLAAAGAFLRKKDALAGALWCVSLVFKPYALVFLPYFLWKKRFRLLGFGTAGLAAGLMLPAVVYGWSGNLGVLKEWAVSLTRSTRGLLAVGDNASLFALSAKSFGADRPALALVSTLAAVAGLGILFLLMIERGHRRGLEKPERLEFVYLLACIPLISPLGWYYNYLYGIPAVCILWSVLPRFATIWRLSAGLNLILLGASIQEIWGRPLFLFYTHHALVAVQFIGVLAFLAAARWREWA